MLTHAQQQQCLHADRRSGPYDNAGGAATPLLPQPPGEMIALRHVRRGRPDSSWPRHAMPTPPPPLMLPVVAIVAAPVVVVVVGAARNDSVEPHAERATCKQEMNSYFAKNVLIHGLGGVPKDE